MKTGNSQKVIQLDHCDDPEHVAKINENTTRNENKIPFCTDGNILLLHINVQFLRREVNELQ